MSAYRVVLLDCDLCGQVYDPGGGGVSATYARVRALARREVWRSWRAVDICPTHNALTMHEAVSAARRRTKRSQGDDH